MRQVFSELLEAYRLPHEGAPWDYHDDPYRRLVLAVFLDGIRLATATRVPVRTTPRDLADAKAWLANEECYPFSFTWCCEMLGLHLESVKEMVVEREEAGGVAWLPEHIYRKVVADPGGFGKNFRGEEGYRRRR